MKTTALANLYEDTETFNRIPGNLESITQDKINNQLKVILSEVNELKDGIQDNDITETVDGCVDVLVTVFGLMQMLERTYGIDFTKACELVAANNLEKYIPEGYTDCRETVERTLQAYEDMGEPVKAVLDKDSRCYYFVDANGKVRKPFGSTPVDLSTCIPTRH